jgi:hypothetical protein
MGSAAVREHVQRAMEVDDATLGAAARMNLTFGCAMGDAIIGDVGCTLGDSEGLCGLVVGRKWSLGMGEAVGLLLVSFGGWKSCWSGVLP